MHLADMREYARRGPVVHRATNWATNNGLKLNASKTKYMIFTNKKTEDIYSNLHGAWEVND